MKSSVRRTDTTITVLLAIAIAGAAILSSALVRVGAQKGSEQQVSAIGRGEIVFAKRNNGGDYNIFSVSPNGTGVCSPGDAISVCPIVQGPISSELTPALSPDGNKLAYAAQPPFDPAGKLQLHILDLTTGNDTQLTNNSDDNAYPAWSPDGTRIAFMRGSIPLNDLVFSSASSQIWIIPAAGGAPTQFTANGTNHVTPAWSPKAGQNVLVFARKSTTSGKYFLEQAVVNNDNTIGALKAFTNLTPNNTSDGNNLFPAWSPDGNRIAFVSDRINPGDAIGDIWILDAATATGSTDAPVTQFTTSSPQFDIEPVWSPDGTQIAWVRGALGSVDPGTFDLWKQGVDASSHPTGAAVNITSGFNEPQVEHSQPSWRLVGANPTPTPTPTPLVCNSGFADCNSNPADGCEINLNVDNNNCGTCGHTCAAGTHCAGGGCVPDATPAVDLAITSLTAPSSVGEGQDIEFQMIIKNKGTLASTGVNLLHTMVDLQGFVGGFTTKPDGSVLASVCQEVDTSVRQVKCQLGTLAPGNSLPLSVHLRFQKAGAPGAGMAEFKISSEQSDANFDDNIASGAVTIVGDTPPANDNVDVVFKNFLKGSGAGVLPNVANGQVAGTNKGATRQDCTAAKPVCTPFPGFPTGEPSHVGNIIGGRSVWYVWQAPASGPVQITTGPSLVDNSAGSNFDTLLAAYRILPDGSIFRVAESDDGAGVSPQSTISFNSESTSDAPVFYFIVVDGYKGATGNIKLSWNLSSLMPREVKTAINGMSPGATCSNSSDASTLCTRDTSGNFLLTVTGINFTSDSRVYVDGRRDLQTDFINSGKLVSHISPSISLKDIKLDKVQVGTRIGSAPASSSAGNVNPEAQNLIEIARNQGQVNVIELHNFVIPPGGSQEVCLGLQGNKNDDETCITFSNDSQRVSATVTPTLFAAVTECAHRSSTLLDFQRCQLDISRADRGQGSGYAWAFNPDVVHPSDTVVVKKKASITPGTQALIAAGAFSPGILVQGGLASLAAIPSNPSGVIAAGGGNIVANDGGTIIAAGAGNIVANDGGTIVANDGGTLLTSDGASIPDFIGGYATSLNSRGSSGASPNGVGPLSSQSQSVRPFASNDLSQGAGGQFVATSSGGKPPTVTISTDPVTGDKVATITMIFDNTSNPRVTDLNNLAFGVALNPAVVQFAANNITADEGAGRATVTLNRSGDTTNAVTVSYATSDGTATVKTDYMPVFGSVTFNPGETQKNVTIPLIDNGYGAASGAQRSFNLTIGNTIGGAIQMPNVATIRITNNDPANLPVNPLDNSDARFFVRQHYLDFLNREPDSGGQDFWANNISSCGSDVGCLEVKEIDTSASFFLSIEFQQEGYLAERTYKAAFGDATGNSTFNGSHTMPVPIIRFNQFLADAYEIGQGVIVNQGNWQQQLSDNKDAYMLDFVQRQAFVSAYPVTLTATEFVNKLFTNAGITPSAADLSTAISRFGNAPTSGDVTARAKALRDVVENATYIQREVNRAFVLMEYFGYLRRNANEGQDTDYAGYDFWLTKLNQFNGNYIRAEMVKAFLSSIEYRQRFRP